MCHKICDMLIFAKSGPLERCCIVKIEEKISQKVFLHSKDVDIS